MGEEDSVIKAKGHLEAATFKKMRGAKETYKREGHLKKVSGAQPG